MRRRAYEAALAANIPVPAQAAFHDAPWDDQPLFTALLQDNVRLI